MWKGLVNAINQGWSISPGVLSRTVAKQSVRPNRCFRYISNCFYLIFHVSVCMAMALVVGCNRILRRFRVHMRPPDTSLNDNHDFPLLSSIGMALLSGRFLFHDQFLLWQIFYLCTFKYIARQFKPRIFHWTLGNSACSWNYMLIEATNFPKIWCTCLNNFMTKLK